MSIWIKICANTSLTDALLAAQAGADAVGFVFAPSPRRVTPQAVAAILPQLPTKVEKIGVFVDATIDEIDGIVRNCGLTGVQLHSNFKPTLPAELRQRFGSGLGILRVVHFGNGAMAQVDIALQDPTIDAVLVDSRTETAVGGTGVAFDWQRARDTLFRNRGERKIIAAGGLKPETVAEAIAVMRPWGVDVVSGVESSPGQKDPQKVRDFIANVREAKEHQ
jgi:phosphoribosylanthranilate isomerase